jgi:L-amino acid N-acyltransferase YncA
MIRAASVQDSAAIGGIYNHYIANSIITFEESPVSAEKMAGRIAEVIASLPWLVFESEGALLGYAYASPWKSRCAYRFAAESTVYLAESATGRGIGSRLYEALLADLRGRSLHSVIGGVALPNAASVALHEKFGFEKVAHFKQVGWKFNRWIDVGYWELML